MKKLSAFEKTGDDNQVNVIFCVRNEKFRLAYFLNYYRKLGVQKFYAIDNDSDDGTQEYLLKQKDVAVFHTDASYKSSNAGRDWTSAIANDYCKEQWCLTLDVDEFFIYPYIEEIPLTGLIEYLNGRKYEGVASLFLDFYSNSLLSKAQYTEGQSPFEVCQYYDNSSSYHCYQVETFPFFEIKGGPRQRHFWSEHGVKSGPSMRKVVLVKWKSSFEYLVAAHSCTPLRLADITGTVAHFKLLSHFKKFAQDEVNRNQRVSNSIDWKVYAKKLSNEDINFFDKELSLHYINSRTLLASSHMASSDNYLSYAQQYVINHKIKPVTKLPKSRIEVDGQSESNHTVQINDFVHIWGSLSQFSKYVIEDTADLQSLYRLEKQMDRAVGSRLWRFSYLFRKYFSIFGLTDQRSITEENYDNQSLHSKFVFVYDSIWWDVLGPFRVIEKILMRLGWLKRLN